MTGLSGNIITGVHISLMHLHTHSFTYKTIILGVVDLNYKTPGTGTGTGTA